MSETAEPNWWPERSKWPDLMPCEEYPHRYLSDEALALLLLDEVVIPCRGGDGCNLQVICNDIFHPAADCEPLPAPTYGVGQGEHSFWSLYDLYRQHGSLGMIMWIIGRRSVFPWSNRVQYKTRLQEAGLWNQNLQKIYDCKPGWHATL